jgi:hypothetical protein
MRKGDVMGKKKARKIASGQPGDRHVWRVGGDRVELTPSPEGWIARVRRSAWGGQELVVDDRFADKAEALAWCQRMAEVLACDLEDAGGGR